MANREKQTESERNDEGAWARFERAVDAAVKSGPKHKLDHEGAEKKPRPAKKPKTPNEVPPE